jgi:16S rRNA (adenine1518-N6/adenine1519-N6)-dimethyltransferase
VPKRTNKLLAKDYDLFAAIVKQAFGQRRKTLRNSLKNLVNDDVWMQVGIKSDLRPENLSVQDFVAISNAML